MSKMCCRNNSATTGSIHHCVQRWTLVRHYETHRVLCWCWHTSQALHCAHTHTIYPTNPTDATSRPHQSTYLHTYSYISSALAHPLLQRRFISYWLIPAVVFLLFQNASYYLDKVLKPLLSLLAITCYRSEQRFVMQERHEDMPTTL